MQGFPTLFAYQIFHDTVTREYFDIPDNYSVFLSGLNKDSYTAMLKEIILGKHQPENVILLEIFPHEQKQELIFIVLKN